MTGRLRPMTDADLSMVLDWRNQPQVRATMYTQHVITAEEHAAWWDRTKADARHDYRIYDGAAGPAGLVSLNAIDTANGTAMWAFYTAPAAPGGTGRAMERLALSLAFADHGLRKLSCEVLAGNARVVRMHERFGFHVEGRFRRHIRVGERYQDVVRLALFAEEWLARTDDDSPGDAEA